MEILESPYLVLDKAAKSFEPHWCALFALEVPFMIYAWNELYNPIGHSSRLSSPRLLSMSTPHITTGRFLGSTEPRRWTSDQKVRWLVSVA